jgi:hypothetical protein
LVFSKEKPNNELERNKSTNNLKCNLSRIFVVDKYEIGLKTS